MSYQEGLLSRRRFLGLAVATGIGLLWPASRKVEADIGPDNFALYLPGITEGRFFTETRDIAPYPQGFSVADDKEAPFWTTFNKFGGAAVWGPPVSSRWRDETGRICQAFQRGIFQLTVGSDNLVKNIEWLNIFDQLSNLGKNDILASIQIPTPFDWSSDKDKSWNETAKNHLALLDQNPAIKAYYLKEQLALIKYGLPVSMQDYGNFVALRCQRTVLQQWKQAAPWAKAGQVVEALGGDIAKKIGGIIPEQAARPVDPPKDAVVQEPRDITQGNTQFKRMAMTFDCGSVAGPTPRIIYTLKENNIQATFFITGQWAETNPELVRLIAANNNPIGNHTYSHPHLREYDDQGITDQLEKAEAILVKLTGQSTRPYWRSPFGEYNQRILVVAARAGWPNHVLWSGEMTSQGWISGDSGDWTDITPARVQANVMRALTYLGNGTITVHHCGSDQETAALKPTIDSIRSAGYGIVTVQELRK